MIWLWAVTAFSASTAIVTGIGWLVTATRLTNLRWKMRQQELAARRAGAFGDHHRCRVHDAQGIYPDDPRAQDLTEIRQRWESHYRNRID